MKCVKIKSIQKINNTSLLYDIEVNKTHCFFADNILVHNSSSTFYIKDGVFGVCSRNLELLETEENTFWKVARELDLENKMKSLGYNVCLQGELIGSGIQGNPYNIKGQTVRFYNVFDIDKQEYLGYNGFIQTLNSLGLDSVPVLDLSFSLPETIDELLSYSENVSMLNDKTQREGVVIRDHDRKISFKVISNKFLLSEK